MNKIKLSAILFLFILTCCSDDDPVKPVSVSSVVATGNDINTNEELIRLFSETAITSNVPVNAIFVISFSKNISKKTATSANIEITKDGIAIPATVSVDGKTVIIIPEDHLVLESSYVLSIGSSIKATDGGAFLETTKNFMTQREPLTVNNLEAVGNDILTTDELIQLFLGTGVTPNIPVNSTFTISFSEAVDASTATSLNIKITKNGIAVASDILVDGATVEITPEDDLELESTYELSLSSAIKSADGDVFTQITKSFITQDNPLYDGLVAHYTFENGLAQDKSGFDNNGVITGAESISDRSNRDAEALKFNDGTDRVYVVAPAFLNNTTGTFAAWVKFDNLDNTQYIASVGDLENTTNYMAFIRIDGADHTIGPYWRNDSEANWLKSSTTVTTGIYYHLAVVANGTQFKIYINGEQVALSVVQGANNGKWISQINSLDNFVIGNVALLQPHPLPNVAGNIDEIRMYNRALSSREITLLNSLTR